MFNHPKMGFTYAGVDSHKDSHTAVLLNVFFEKLGEITFSSSPGSFEKAISKLEKLKAQGTSLMFGLEDYSAYGRHLALFLVKKGFPIKHVNSALVAHERKSLNVLHKSDSFDAECAARVLLNRFDQLPDADPHDKYWTLSQLVTRRNSIVKQNVALKNSLQSLIMQHYPSFKSFFSHAACKSSLAFLEKYPSPSKLGSVTLEELTEYLSKFGKALITPEKVQILFTNVEKDGDTKGQYQDIRDSMVISTVNQLKYNMKEIKTIEKQIKQFLQEFDYKLETMRGISSITAASLISEIGDIEKFSNAAKLAKYSGTSPVTYASGKRDLQFANERGNRRLNQIFRSIAVTLCREPTASGKVVNSYFYSYYKKKLSEGKTKMQSIKCAERRLVNIIWAMMTYKTEYRNPPAMNEE